MRRSVSTKALAIGMFVVALVLAGVVSFYASGSPDGLERVAEDEGFIQTAEDPATADGPFADYGASFLDGDRASVGVAGVVGVLVTLALGAGIAYVVRRQPGAGGSAPAAGPVGHSGPGHDDATAPTSKSS